MKLLGSKTCYVCTKCHSPLARDENIYRCKCCGHTFSTRIGIPDFRDKDGYWCNVDRAKMQLLNERAKESGKWEDAAQEIIPEYYNHIHPYSRADCQFLWPIDENSIVLDAGSMWGGLTIPVAQYCKEIHAVDKTVETLEFLDIRAKQIGLGNIKTVASSLNRLPFPDKSFDLVILNGVLEWVAFGQDLVLEKHWGEKRKDSPVKYEKSPRDMQLDVLRELNRVLKPNGSLFLAIENAIGYRYLTGLDPDPHVNIRFLTFLPRKASNFISKVRLNHEYRVYIYSPKECHKILNESGFNRKEFYGAFDHYGAPQKVIPHRIVGGSKKIICNLGRSARWFYKFIPNFLAENFSPSLMVVAGKDGKDTDFRPRILRLLKKANLLHEDDISLKDVIYYGGRAGNHMTSNYLIADRKTEAFEYFCKVGRHKDKVDILRDESDRLKSASRLLTKNSVKYSIPKPVFYGKIEGITILVTKYIESNPSRVDFGKALKGRNIKHLDREIMASVEALVEIQKSTRINVGSGNTFADFICRCHSNLEKRNQVHSRYLFIIKNMEEKIRQNGNELVYRCAVHCDYNLYTNIFFNSRGPVIFDFEHFEEKGFPFFDLGQLIFVPLIINWKEMNYAGPDHTLKQFLLNPLRCTARLFKIKKQHGFLDHIDKYQLRPYINRWVDYYSKLAGIPRDILSDISKISVIEHKAKEYPYYRDPESFPLYGDDIFEDMIQMNV